MLCGARPVTPSGTASQCPSMPRSGCSVSICLPRFGLSLGSFSEGPARGQATGTGACLLGRSLMIQARDSDTRQRHAAHKQPESATFYDPGTITVTRVIRP